MRYSITPVIYTPFGGSETTLTSIYMVINYAVGSTSMNVPYNICDADDKPIVNGFTTISEAELDQWGTDNMYIVNLVAADAGVTIV